MPSDDVRSVLSSTTDFFVKSTFWVQNNVFTVPVGGGVK